jgi:hypothetical protein
MNEETNELTDKTYTVNSEESYFDNKEMHLKIFLPQEVAENPYQYTVYDMSQLIDNVQQNAIFIYMRRLNDDGTDLSGNDDDKTECDFSFHISNAVQLVTLTNFSTFDIQENNALVTIYHDENTLGTYKQTCAEKMFLEVTAALTNVIANGNFQCTMELMAGQPRKSGSSWIPKR